MTICAVPCYKCNSVVGNFECTREDCPTGRQNIYINQFKEIKQALRIATRELEDWYLKGGGLNTRQIILNNYKLVGSIDE